LAGQEVDQVTESLGPPEHAVFPDRIAMRQILFTVLFPNRERLDI
jgi:hypothetical protein